MLRAFWQSVVWSKSGLEFPLLLATTVIFPEIFTPPFLRKAKTAALRLRALPPAGKNSLFVFMSMDSSWNLLLMITKHYNWDHRSALKTCKQGCELVLWSGLRECRTASARVKVGASPLWPPPPAGWTNNPSNSPVVGQGYHGSNELCPATSVPVASID